MPSPITPRTGTIGAGKSNRHLLLLFGRQWLLSQNPFHLTSEDIIDCLLYTRNNM
jgi:hypothetical protein